MPNPPPPTAPAIAVSPITLIIVDAETLNRLGSPSLKYTRVIISQGVDPIAKAASITPGSTSSKAISTCLAKKGIVPAIIGTAAADGPIDVPTIQRVTPTSKANRMIKGIDRKILINESKIL